jgi:regulator of cell morphogenesis and NO signaling
MNTTITPELTVGEIAAAYPLSARVFEQLGIDFCCGGKLALAEACTRKSLDLTAVIDRIQAGVEPAGSTADWQSAALSVLIDHILTAHHAYTKSQLPRLGTMLDKILAKHGGRHGAVLQPVADIFRAMRNELESHLMKEEMILFPLIRQMESAGDGAGFHCGSVRNPIRVMTAEHDSAGDALARLRELTGGYTPPADACNTFRAFYAELAELERDLHQHIHLENNILFPRAVALEAAVAPV